MSSRFEPPIQRTIWWLFTILAAVAVVILLFELVSLFIAAGGAK